MKRINIQTFRTKVLIIIVSFLVFFISLIWFLQIGFLESYYQFAKERSVRATANQLEMLVKKYHPEEILDMIEKIAFDGDLCVELRDLQGNPKFLVDMAGQNCVIHSNKSLLSTQLVHMFNKEEGKQLSRTLTSYKYDTNSFLLIREIIDYQGQPCLLWVSSPLLPLQSTIDILKQQFLFVIVILLLTGVSISFFISNFLTKPIEKISAATKEICKGNFNAKIQVNGSDEISQMAANFNYMVDEINKTENTRHELLANISHDLRTPLTMIKGYAETIKEISGDDPEKRNKHLDIIMRESDRLCLLVEDVLNFTTLNQDGYVLDKNVFDIGKVLRDTVDRYGVITQQYKISYLGETSCLVYADQKRVEQVIYNLLNNAINHVGQDHQIAIDLIRHKGNCRISISDHGSGIDPEHLPLIWDRYYRVDKTGKRLVKGTGLGLSIVKAIMHAHNSDYGIESTLNQGSSFWFEVPLHFA